VMSNNKLTEENKTDIDNILLEINHKVLDHLAGSDHSTKEMDEIVNKVYAFVLSENGTISGRLKDRVFRFMRDVHKSIENLHAIHTHRTPISLKAYCQIFIYIFPIIYAPVIISEIGMDANQWITYLMVVTTEFILISLFNIQDQLEYPFDNVGMDDINLDAFKMDR
jgi:predicted membrane chloride channel (bestrophin family)